MFVRSKLRHLLFACLATITVFATFVGTAATSIAAPFEPERLEVTTLTSDMTRPMELDIAPDGRVFWIELDGKLKVLDPKTGKVTLVAEIKVTTAQENGLIGLALDPDFARTQHIFLQYSPPDYPGQHISRFTLKDGKLDMASEKVLLKFTEQRKQCCHHAGSMQFGPDGCLFISTGDNTHPGGNSAGYAPIDERPGQGPYDAQKSAANTNHLSGKILRIKPTPDGRYTIPKGNLFSRHEPDPKDKDAIWGLPEIFVMGCRNPWRINVDQKTGFLYWGEVGPDAGNDGARGPRGYDEINQARQAGNFGWPYVIANNQPYPDFDFATNKIGPKYDPKRPINESPNSNGSRVLPPAQPAFVYYPGAATKTFPVVGSGGRTACAGPVYHFDAKLKSKTKLHEYFDNTLFIYEWSRHWVIAVHLTPDSKIKSMERFLPSHGFKRPIDMSFGPDGSLYVVEYGSSWGVNQDTRLVRIDYFEGNRAPVAKATAENNVGKQPLAVKFSSEGTRDKDPNDKLQYRWQINPPTGKVIGTASQFKHTFTDPGVYNVALTVTDAAGESGSSSVAVLVGNARPTVKFISPRDGGFFDPDKSIRYEVAVADAEDGDSDFNDLDIAKRLFVTGGSPANAAIDDEANMHPGLSLMKNSDCFNCHAVHQKIVGPAYMDVAKKYKGDAAALEAATQRVIAGSTGAWGKLPMLPHPQHTVEEARAMVNWVFSLQENDTTRSMSRGLIGTVAPKRSKDAAVGSGSRGYELEAIYTDRGADPVGPLAARATVRLRPRRVQAEGFDHKNKMQVLGGGNADQGKFIGDISHGGYLKFSGIDLADTDHVTFRACSGGFGGHIELRVGKPDGPTLARVEVKNTGGWDKWIEKTTAIKNPGGINDLYIVFINPKNKSGGMMNLDWVEFVAKK